MMYIIAETLSSPKRLHKPKRNLVKYIQKAPSVGAFPHQDMSLPVLQRLASEGYNKVTFRAHKDEMACPICRKFSGRTFNLLNYIATTTHEAPIFSHTHVNCYCSLLIWDDDQILPDLLVDYTGNIETLPTPKGRNWKAQLEKVLTQDYQLPTPSQENKEKAEQDAELDQAIDEDYWENF